MKQNPAPVASLDEKIIRSGLATSSNRLLVDLTIFESVGSTNDLLMSRMQKAENTYVACIANQQTAGRGRNGRIWQSPANANIYMSVGFSVNDLQGINLSGLSIISGVAIARFLQQLGIAPLLKWPNDLLVAGKKLAGVLIETRIKADCAYVIVGVGLNVKMPGSSAQDIDQPWTDMLQCLPNLVNEIERNSLVSGLLDALISSAVEYQRSGFYSFMDDWKKFDMLAGREVTVLTDQAEVSGKVLGINQDYALRLEVGGKEKVFYAADIKLKL